MGYSQLSKLYGIGDKTMHEVSYSMSIDKESESYNHYGSEAKEKMQQLIKQEGIILKSSFEHSINRTASYEQSVVIKPQKKKEIYHSIIVPTFTDDSEIEQAITLAHELGHYYVFKEASKTKLSFLTAGLNITTYINEKFAWKKAMEILVKEGVINESGNELQRQAFQDYNRIKKKNLQTYGHSLLSFTIGIKNTVFHLLQALIASYLFVAFLFLLSANHIPVPFLNGFKMEHEHFYSYVFMFFGFYLCGIWVIILLKFVNRINNW